MDEDLQTIEATPEPELQPEATPLAIDILASDANIICDPIIGDKIANGFFCNINKLPASDLITFDYQGQQWQTLFKNQWSAADVVISVLLGFICFYLIIDAIFRIVFRRKTAIYNKLWHNFSLIVSIIFLSFLFLF